jgi:hypothetical protein
MAVTITKRTPNSKILNAGEDVEKKKLSCTISESVN